MADTPRLDLPYLSASQAQKEIMHNVGLDRLDILVQCAVLDKDLTAPPSGVDHGDAFIVGPAPTGTWAGHATHLALYNNLQWQFIAPLEGFQCWVIDEAVLYVWNGTAWFAVQNANDFLGLPDTPDSYGGQAGKSVIVNGAGTGLEFGVPPAGATTFLALTDTPSAYTGTAGQYVRVNGGATGLEFGAGSTASFLALSDTPDAYSGQNGKVVAVKSDATGLEFVPGGGGGGSLGLHRGALLQRATVLAVPDLTPTLVPWASAVYDNASLWNISQPTRVVVPAGVSRFMVQAQVEFDGPASGTRRLRLLKNGLTVAGQGMCQIPLDYLTLPAPNVVLAVITPPLPVTVGDYFELEVMQNSTTALNVLGGEQTWLAGIVISEPTASGATFTSLSDTPDSYTGQAGRVVSVKGDESGVEFTALTIPAQPYDLGVTWVGTLPASQVLLRYPFPRAVTFPAGLTGSQGRAAVAATALTTIDVRKNGASVGSISFAAAGTTATFTMASAQSFAAGDVLTLVAPATPDATLADLGLALAGTR